MMVSIVLLSIMTCIIFYLLHTFPLTSSQFKKIPKFVKNCIDNAVRDELDKQTNKQTNKQKKNVYI